MAKNGKINFRKFSNEFRIEKNRFFACLMNSGVFYFEINEGKFFWIVFLHFVLIKIIFLYFVWIKIIFLYFVWIVTEEKRIKKNFCKKWIFSLCRNDIYGAAVCLYDMASVQRVFQGSYQHQPQLNSTWIKTRNDLPLFNVNSALTRI